MNNPQGPYQDQPQRPHPPHQGQPPYQGQPGGYGAMPPMPGGGVTPEPPRPQEVLTAFWLWIASMVVSVIGNVVGFLTLGDRVRSQVRQQVGTDPNLSAANVDTIVRIGFIVGAVVALLFVALELFFVFKMRAGRNWARIVLTVLGGLSVLLTIVGLRSAAGLTAVIGLVGSALIVAAIVLMFTGGAREYFAPRPRN